jgi:hypothetical protein
LAHQIPGDVLIKPAGKATFQAVRLTTEAPNAELWLPAGFLFRPDVDAKRRRIPLSTSVPADKDKYDAISRSCLPSVIIAG